MKKPSEQGDPSQAFQAKLTKLYTRLAPVYDVWGWLTESHAHARALEAAQITGDEAVLEVAVGSGVLFERLGGALPGGRVVGIDLAPGMLRRTRCRMARHQCQGALCLADASRLPFAAASFDALFNCFMLDLQPEATIPKTLAEFRRVLKPEGRLVLLTMARQAKPFDAVWMRLYRWSPALVAGCRPIATAAYLEAAGWRVQRGEQISQMGFRSELYVARPPKPTQQP